MIPPSQLKESLVHLAPTIKELMTIAGTAGVSLGVLHHGEIIHCANFGFRDVRARLSVNKNTVFPIGSLTAAIVSATIGVLVEEKLITWNTKVIDVLPDFHPQDEVLRDLTTITDVLAHRTGMARSIASQSSNLIKKEDSLAFLNGQRAVQPFREQWQYNPLGCDIAGLVIEKITGKRWDEVVHDKILKPLGLHRTSATDEAGDDNVTKTYATMDDGSPVEITSDRIGADTFGGADSGMRSCVKDLVRLYNELMKAWEKQLDTEDDSTVGSPFKQVCELMSAKISMGSKYCLHEQSYALGWARTQTPGSIGGIGLNSQLMCGCMPHVGLDSPSRLIMYHQGHQSGCFGAVNLLPETKSAIVVLTNTLALNDCADWIGQLVLEILINDQTRQDSIKSGRDTDKMTIEWARAVRVAANRAIEGAKYSASRALRRHTLLKLELEKNRIPNTSPRALEQYVGTYTNETGLIKLVVTHEGTSEKACLYFALQGLESEKYALKHYHNDDFVWLQPREELARRGKATVQESSFYKIRFEASDGGAIDRLRWGHSTDITGGEIFYKVRAEPLP